MITVIVKTTKFTRNRLSKTIVSTLLLIMNYNQDLIKKIQTKLMIGKLQTVMKVNLFWLTTITIETTQYAHEYSIHCILD